MLAIHHLGFVLRLLGDHPERVVGGLYRCTKFDWNWQCIFEDM